MIHLDTNFLIAALQVGSAESRQLQSWRQAGERFGLSAVAWAEYLCGPYATGDEARAWAIFDAVEPLTVEDAERGAELFNATGRRSRTLADSLIAASALRCGARVATVNVEDFEPFVAHGLVLA